MISPIVTNLKHKGLKRDQGSFTVEGSMVFPVIILCMVAVIFASLYVYQSALLHYWASMTAERTAYGWNNSHKDWVNGSHTPGQHDGLYWRFFQDGGLGFFGVYSSSKWKIDLPAEPLRASSGLVNTKLRRAAIHLPQGIKGSIEYEPHLLERKITVRLQGQLKLPQLVMKMLKVDMITAEAISAVTEPTEFIRSVDLVRNYAGQIKDRITAKRAKEIIKEPLTSDTGLVKLQSHKEAAPYLRKLTHGTERKFALKNGTMRVVDSLDKEGIAHQAYYTFSEKQIRTQMLKDIELIKNDSVSGVVWHFFATDSGVNPSTALQAELARNGIIVLIH